MDAARAYRKFLIARIRVERLNSFLDEHPNSLVQARSRDRLPAGGPYTSATSVVLSYAYIPKCKSNEVQPKKCPCEDIMEACPEKQIEEKSTNNDTEPCEIKFQKEKEKETPKKRSKKCECKCKRPIIVVPSKRGLKYEEKKRNGAVISNNDSKNKTSSYGITQSKQNMENPRCESSRNPSDDTKMTTSKQNVEDPRCESSRNPSDGTKMTPSKQNVKDPRCESSRNPSDDTKMTPSKQNVENPRCSSSRCPSNETCNYDRRHPKENIYPSKNGPNCTQCEKIPVITKELCILKKNMEQQVGQEVKQREQLNAMNLQLKELNATVKTLNEKCKMLGNQTDKLTKERTAVACECPKNAPVNFVRYRDDRELEFKASSLCQFCKNKNLTVINSMQFELCKMIGDRCFQDIALTILLRADNIYHVNVRDLNNGAVLGCLLVSETGIDEANCLGMFQQILTFYVKDVRNTINNKKAILGGINFELIHKQRLTGGNALVPMIKAAPSDEQLPKEQSALELCVIDASKATQNFQTFSDISSEIWESFSNWSTAEVMPEIDSYSSSLELTDRETAYPVRHVRISRGNMPITNSPNLNSRLNETNSTNSIF